MAEKKNLNQQSLKFYNMKIELSFIIIIIHPYAIKILKKFISKPEVINV